MPSYTIRFTPAIGFLQHLLGYNLSTIFGNGRRYGLSWNRGFDVRAFIITGRPRTAVPPSLEEAAAIRVSQNVMMGELE
jgi:hypothetical protein